MKLALCILLMVFLAAVLLAQAPVHPATTVANGDNLPVQQIGIGDLLGVRVYDAPELTGTFRVSNDGTIRLPMISEPIKVAGLLPPQLEDYVTVALKSGNVLVDPIVTVTIMEYQSRPVQVIGAVRTPLTFQAFGNVTLVDALTRAGGVSDNAGTDVLVSQSVSEDGALPLTRRIPLKGLMDGSDVNARITLHGGEEVRVPEADKIYVVGNVRKPGAFIVRDGTKPSLLKMLALSEGLTRYAQKTAYIYRGDAGSPQKKEIPIELSKILQRKAPDVPLEPNDVLYIPENGRSHDMGTILNTLMTIGGAGLGSTLIYTVAR